MCKTILILCGVCNIIDAVWSLLHPKLGHWFVSDLGRWVRLLVGFIILVIGLKFRG